MGIYPKLKKKTMQTEPQLTQRQVTEALRAAVRANHEGPLGLHNLHNTAATSHLEDSVSETEEAEREAREIARRILDSAQNDPAVVAAPATEAEARATAEALLDKYICTRTNPTRPYPTPTPHAHTTTSAAQRYSQRRITTPHRPLKSTPEKRSEPRRRIEHTNRPTASPRNVVRRLPVDQPPPPSDSEEEDEVHTNTPHRRAVDITINIDKREATGGERGGGGRGGSVAKGHEKTLKEAKKTPVPVGKGGGGGAGGGGEKKGLPPTCWQRFMAKAGELYGHIDPAVEALVGVVLVLLRCGAEDTVVVRGGGGGGGGVPRDSPWLSPRRRRNHPELGRLDRPPLPPHPDVLRDMSPQRTLSPAGSGRLLKRF